MFNSSHLCVETPQKLYLRQIEVTPVKLTPVKERFSPTYSVKKVLKSLNRVHNFQYHEPIELIDLEVLGIERFVGDEIVEFLKTADISDTIVKFEEIAVAQKYFNVDIKEYLAEEFNCPEEHSFPILAVFHYKKKYNIGLEAALSELFTLSTKKSLCCKCVAGLEDESERKQAAEFYNFSQVRSLIFCTTERNDIDLDIDDDSMDDPNYVFKSDEEILSDISTPLKEKEVKYKTKIFNPFLSPFNPDVIDVEGGKEVTKAIFNPFLASDDNSDFESFSPQMNSTVSSNFRKCNSYNGKLNKSPIVKCTACEKTFSNSYNMKLHLIRNSS